MDTCEVLDGDQLHVARWRIERFQSLGFSDDNADLLGNGDVDWHEAAALIAAGCPVETALLILT